ncbi:proteasome subunit beta type-4-like [Oppia nitens]|uniref:proteasome subunit beta type-4-like n=1 Tax=Oppia nitens TaxID=1686743 RepID=UPI0023DAF3B2|nr:proteasome subunit beta type-4-like [Oppia nitens]
MAKTLMSYETDGSRQWSQSPVTTGTSVLGIAFDGGVIIAADILASYGSLARFRNTKRVFKVNDKCLVGCSGDIADYQFLIRAIDQKMIDEDNHNDDHTLTPNALFSWLTRVHYNRRSKFDPLWCQWVIGGLNSDDQPFLGYVDKLGTAYECPAIATGYGSYIAIPLLRQALDEAGGKLTEEQAKQVIQKCLTVLYYRDARSFNKYELAVVKKSGATVEGPLTLDSNWSIAHYVKGYGGD